MLELPTGGKVNHMLPQHADPRSCGTRTSWPETCGSDNTPTTSEIWPLFGIVWLRQSSLKIIYPFPGCSPFLFSPKSPNKTCGVGSLKPWIHGNFSPMSLINLFFLLPNIWLLILDTEQQTNLSLVTKPSSLGTSLFVQWLGVCLPMPGAQVRSLVQEDPTCRGATKPAHCNCWAHTF